MNVEKPKYKDVAPLVEDWLEIHKGETFDLDTICRQLQAVSREGRQLVAIKLSNEIKNGKLEKLNRIYRYIDNTIKSIDWVNASTENSIAIKFPYGVDDKTRFGFDGHVVISPGDVIVVAGLSNMGKTTWCLNFLWENMDNYPCTLMGNEYSPIKFKRRVSRMNWKNPLSDDGIPKFELIERRDNWKDIIRPDNINIIDWIQLDDKFYQIGTIIDGIQAKLREGIAVVVLQKSEGKTLGLGGGFSQHLSSLYLSIDFEKLTVIKAKEWYEGNPNGKMYGFSIVNSGTMFSNIREVKTCPKCRGYKFYKGAKCDECLGTGHVDIE